MEPQLVRIMIQKAAASGSSEIRFEPYETKDYTTVVYRVRMRRKGVFRIVRPKISFGVVAQAIFQFELWVKDPFLSRGRYQIDLTDDDEVRWNLWTESTHIAELGTELVVRLLLDANRPPRLTMKTTKLPLPLGYSKPVRL